MIRSHTADRTIFAASQLTQHNVNHTTESVNFNISSQTISLWMKILHIPYIEFKPDCDFEEPSLLARGSHRSWPESATDVIIGNEIIPLTRQPRYDSEALLSSFVKISSANIYNLYTEHCSVGPTNFIETMARLKIETIGTARLKISKFRFLNLDF